MKNLIHQYETAKREAVSMMKKGQINGYLTALLEMRKCERLMMYILAN